MTKYELPNGMTVMIPTELLLKMTDSELQDYLANASGFQVNDPFYDSVLDDGVILEDFDLPDGIDEIPEGFIDPTE